MFFEAKIKIIQKDKIEKCVENNTKQILRRQNRNM